jgi:hypothetical protein
VAKQVDFCQIVVSDMMEGYKSDWLRDIGDLLLDDFRRNGEQVTPTKKEPQPAIVVQISPKQRILNDMIASNPAIGPRRAKLLVNHILISVVRLNGGDVEFRGISYFPQEDRDLIEKKIIDKIRLCGQTDRTKDHYYRTFYKHFNYDK